MMSPEQFAQAVIEVLRTLGVKGEMEYLAREFELRINNSSPKGLMRMNLGNAYNDYLKVPKERQQDVIPSFAHAAVAALKGTELPSEYATAMPQLGLSIWSSASLDLPRCAVELENADPRARRYVQRPLADDLVVSLAYDGGEFLMHLRERDLEQLGETPEVALRDATANLLRKRALIDQIRSVFCFQTGDSYDAARIVLVERLRQLPVQGQLVALVPDRDSLIITGSADVDGLAQMAEMGLECFQKNSRLISGRPMVLKESRWIRFEPPEQVGEAFAQLARLSDTLDYDSQADVLRKLCEKRGDGALVANVVKIPMEMLKGFATATAWVRGITALLPKVEMIAFIDGSTGQPALAAWDDVARVVSHLMQPTQDVPPRYRVESYPTPEEMEAIGVARTRPAHLTPGPTFRPH